jgi:hypothetical protein
VVGEGVEGAYVALHDAHVRQLRLVPQAAVRDGRLDPTHIDQNAAPHEHGTGVEPQIAGPQKEFKSRLIRTVARLTKRAKFTAPVKRFDFRYNVVKLGGIAANERDPLKELYPKDNVAMEVGKVERSTVPENLLPSKMRTDMMMGREVKSTVPLRPTLDKSRD